MGKNGKKDKNTQLIDHEQISMTLKRNGPYHYLGSKKITGFKRWNFDSTRGREEQIVCGSHAVQPIFGSVSSL